MLWGVKPFKERPTIKKRTKPALSTPTKDKQTGKPAPSSTSRTSTPSESLKRNIGCDHADWYAFNDENNVIHCLEGFDYHGASCFKCHCKIVAMEDITIKCFRPCIYTPLKTCPNRHSHKCKFAVCYPCYLIFVQTEMNKKHGKVGTEQSPQDVTNMIRYFSYRFHNRSGRYSMLIW